MKKDNKEIFLVVPDTTAPRVNFNKKTFIKFIQKYYGSVDDYTKSITAITEKYCVAHFKGKTCSFQIHFQQYTLKEIKKWDF